MATLEFDVVFESPNTHSNEFFVKKADEGSASVLASETKKDIELLWSS